jgi:hypothetical protein
MDHYAGIDVSLEASQSALLTGREWRQQRDPHDRRTHVGIGALEIVEEYDSRPRSGRQLSIDRAAVMDNIGDPQWAMSAAPRCTIPPGYLDETSDMPTERIGV